MADAELEVRLRQLEQENAALQERLAQSGSTIEPKPLLAVSRVAVKLPPFWSDRPAIWFSQAEAQFDIAGITADSTKFNYIIAHLDQRLALEVEDIIINPPAEEKYVKLKYELIRRLSISEEQRVRQLISDEELGDRRPSQFLRHLRSLAGTALADDNILRQLWMRRLSTSVQAILASQPELSLDKLADLADKVSEITATHQVYTCATPSPPPSSSSLDILVEQVAEIKLQVAALSLQHRSRSRNRSTNQHSRNGTPAKVCWYHKKFGTQATRCTQPCSWRQENEKGSQ